MPNQMPDHGDQAAKLLAKWFWKEGENLNLRTDWFLIFHAILIEAYISAKPPQNPATRDVLIESTIIAFGLLTSAVWFLVGARNQWHILHFNKCLEDPEIVSAEVARVMSEIRRVRRREEPCWMRWAIQVALFARVIPLACFGTWAGFGVASWGPLVAIVACVAAVLAIWVLQLKPPTIPQEAIVGFRRPTAGGPPAV